MPRTVVTLWFSKTDQDHHCFGSNITQNLHKNVISSVLNYIRFQILFEYCWRGICVFSLLAAANSSFGPIFLEIGHHISMSEVCSHFINFWMKLWGFLKKLDENILDFWINISSIEMLDVIGCIATHSWYALYTMCITHVCTLTYLYYFFGGLVWFFCGLVLFFWWPCMIHTEN